MSVCFKTAVMLMILALPCFLRAELRLTEEERAWIRANPVIRAVIDPAFPPVEYNGEDGVPRGISVDFMRLLEKKSGLKVEFVAVPDWNSALAAIADKRVEILCAAIDSMPRRKFVLFTRPYISAPGVIVTRSSVKGHMDVLDLNGKDVGVTSGYGYGDFLRQGYPEIKLREVSNSREGLRMLSAGELTAMIEFLPTVTYYIEEEGITNLRIAGVTPFKVELSMGCRNDCPTLRQILDKFIAQMPESERAEIYSRWVSLKYEPFYLRKEMWFLTGGVLAVLLVLLLWNRGLRMAVAQRTARLKRELEERERVELALRDKEEILGTTLNSTADGILVVNSEFKVLHRNRRFVEMWGVSTDLAECYDDAALLSMVSDKVVNSEGFLLRVYELYGSEEVSLEEVVLKDGRIFERYSCPFRSQGVMVGRVWNFRDITARRHAEERLRASEERLKMLIQLAPDTIIHMNQEGMIINVNAAAVVLSGYSLEELTGMDVRSLFSSATHERKPLRFDLVANGRTVTNERELLRKDGSSVIVEMTSRAMPDKTFISFFRDISERLAAQAELREEREQLLSIFDSIDEIIYISDTETYEVLYVNKAFERMLGRNVVGEICYRAFQGKDRPCEFCTNEIIRKLKPEVYRWEYYNPLLDKHLSIIDRMIRWPDGREVRFELAVDITALKKTMAEHEKLLLQLAQSQKMESVGRLAGGIAHDFNNMLNVILGSAELGMRKLDSGDELHKRFSGIKMAAERSADLTRQLLAFARKQAVSPKVLKLNETMAGMLEVLQRLIGEDIRLTWIPGPGLWRVKIDPSQLDQVLVNLCVNARDAISGTGHLSIETANVALSGNECRTRFSEIVPGEYVVISVSDDGCGMDAATCERLFEPFFTTKEVGRGTGLGLSTVYGIIRQNNGYINVYSEPGHGSTFRIYLPRHHGADEAIETVTMPESPFVEGRGTILLVEDEPMLMELSRQMIEALGYTVISAGTPGEALILAERHGDKLDLLITDVVMPECNGRELAEKLSNMIPGLKVLYMSGYTANVIVHHGILEDSINFIQKPYSAREMAERIRAALAD